MPDMNQQAMMAQQLRAKPAELPEVEESAPRGCMCPECPMRERCHAGGGGPSEEMKGGGMEGMGGMMKGGAA